MTHMVDIHSDTWGVIEELLKLEREKAINSLIADNHSDNQRGKLQLIDKILTLKSPNKFIPVDQDTYR